ncbi:MAG TPA: alpha/beta fold hydrolase [Ornithinibacter sp.]|nr:alpha/beta fold hydrolase [Ornithinibacter sp.]
MDAAGLSSAHVVGHDWGGAVAWYLGAHHADRVDSLTVISTPHPSAFANSMVRSLQPLRSWYTLAVQLPVLPELVLRRLLTPGEPRHPPARPARSRSRGTARRCRAPRRSRR